MQTSIYKAGARPHHLHPKTHIPTSHSNSPDYKAMSGLIDGQYTIRVAAGSKPLVGVDLAFNALLVPVITDPIDFVVSPLVFV